MRLAVLLSAYTVMAALPIATARAERGSIAFFYGADVPLELARSHAQLVVQPGHVPDPLPLRRAGTEPVAYVSVGEVAGDSAEARTLAPGFFLGENPAWRSRVMDVRNPGYRAHLLSRVGALWDAGYRRFFLDTLDSYQLVASTEVERAQHCAALVQWLEALWAQHPEAEVLLNRGFELLPAVGKRVSAVVAESLFDRFEAATGAYTRVPAADRAWLTERLREAQVRYGIEAIVIDYRPPQQRRQARATARAIAALGFTPYVSDGALATIGLGLREVLPRRVLVVGQGDDAGACTPPSGARVLAPVLEHLGLVPVYHDLSRGLPPAELVTRHAGVVAFLEDDTRVPEGYGGWLLHQVRAGVPVALFGAPGFAVAGPVARELGFAPVTAASGRGPGQVVQRSARVGFEAEPPGRALAVTALSIRAAVPDLIVTDLRGRAGVAIATTPFGGVAFSHVFAMRGLSGERAWVVDPVAFVAAALRLPAMPIADLTTEQGRRLAVIRVDAEGLDQRARLPGRPRIAQVLQRRLWPPGLRHSLAWDSHEAAPSAGDRARAQALARQPHVRISEAPFSPSQTRVTDADPSVTRVDSVLSPIFTHGGCEAAPPRLPTANDAAFIQDAPEAYPFAQVQQTWARTDAPRRLSAIGLHYHAWAAASPGGLAALARAYQWIEAQAPYAIFADDFAARARAFAELVITRDLDGGFALHGGEALATVRVPEALGTPWLSRSTGVTSVRKLAQGLYVGFQRSGPRALVFAPAAAATGLDAPHLIEASFALERLVRVPGGAHLQLAEPMALGLSFTLSGLPVARACVLSAGRRVLWRGQSDADGRVQVERVVAKEGLLALGCEPTRPGAPGSEPISAVRRHGGGR